MDVEIWVDSQCSFQTFTKIIRDKRLYYIILNQIVLNYQFQASGEGRELLLEIEKNKTKKTKIFTKATTGHESEPLVQLEQVKQEQFKERIVLTEN